MLEKEFWKEYKLIVTDPPKHTGHFGLIKQELIPFINRHPFPFWITNYFDPKSDFILFRVKCTEDQSNLLTNFLNDLIVRGSIATWQGKSWNPQHDAGNRISNLKRFGFDPKKNRIIGLKDKMLLLASDSNGEERHKQLTSLFEALGECTIAIYRHLESKPSDLWITSVFIHLFLNSMDYSGPSPFSEEYWIRKIPPV